MRGLPMPIAGPAATWQQRLDRAASARAYFAQNRADRSKDRRASPSDGPTHPEVVIARETDGFHREGRA